MSTDDDGDHRPSRTPASHNRDGETDCGLQRRLVTRKASVEHRAVASKGILEPVA